MIEREKLPPITHFITGLEVGGAERALHTLLMNGLEGPFRNRVVSLMGPGHYGPLLEKAGIPVTCLEMNPGRPSPRALLRLYSACSVYPCALVQGWMPHGNLAASLVHRLMRQKQAALAWNIRISLEGLHEMRTLTRNIIRMSAQISGRPDALIYNSQRSLQQYTEIGYSLPYASYIPNGFDLEKWSPNANSRSSIRQTLSLSDDDLVFGFVGRGAPQKDLSNLYEAFGRTSIRNPNAILVMVGRDHAVPISSQAKIRSLGERADIPDLMQAFDFLCLSSRSEGFPNVLGEAMASGVPCISTDVGDAQTIIGDTGWIVPPRNSVALADALNAALDVSAETRTTMGRAARKRIEQEFSIPAIVSQYTALYKKLIAGKR
ncbi:glycosyltransferase [Notoacmeibacter marinus]|uniref:glycosyltransferase n=1 Tax=Notoacmeibacter marinus TaxID=1876515 RepID=UPI000DF40930|nr:glycosyltransferase [Notoacmeibacter marinus]